MVSCTLPLEEYLAQMLKNVDLAREPARYYTILIQVYDMYIQKGDSYAMNGRAQLYEGGLGGPVNYKEAMRLYDLAIEFGSVFALHNWANMYQWGKGCDFNYKKSSDLYTRAIGLEQDEGCIQATRQKIAVLDLLSKLRFDEHLNAIRKMQKNPEMSFLFNSLCRASNDFINQFRIPDTADTLKKRRDKFYTECRPVLKLLKKELSENYSWLNVCDQLLTIISTDYSIYRNHFGMFSSTKIQHDELKVLDSAISSVNISSP